MNLLFPDQGLVEQISRILTAGVKYHLYTNNLTPTLATALVNLTEAGWTGYAAVTLDFTNFTINGVAGNSGYALASPITFTNSTGSTVNPYGYYVTDTAVTKLLAIARFDGAPSPILAAGSLNVVPVWGDFSQLSA
jgi:hypothetical protein